MAGEAAAGFGLLIVFFVGFWREQHRDERGIPSLVPMSLAKALRWLGIGLLCAGLLGSIIRHPFAFANGVVSFSKKSSE
jgi:hypothetical protein